MRRHTTTSLLPGAVSTESQPSNSSSSGGTSVNNNHSNNQLPPQGGGGGWQQFDFNPLQHHYYAQQQHLPPQFAPPPPPPPPPTMQHMSNMSMSTVPPVPLQVSPAQQLQQQQLVVQLQQQQGQQMGYSPSTTVPPTHVTSMTPQPTATTAAPEIPTVFSVAAPTPSRGFSPPPCVRETADVMQELRDAPRHIFEWTSLYDDHSADVAPVKKWNPTEAASVLSGNGPSELEEVLLGKYYDKERNVNNIQQQRSTDGSAVVSPSTPSSNSSLPAVVTYVVPSKRHAIDAPPCSRSGHTSTFIPAMNSLIVFGGTTSEGMSADGYSDEVYQLEVHSGHWFVLETTGVAPPKTFGHTTNAMSDGRTMFCYGGQGSNYVVGGYVWYLDLINCSWSHKHLLRHQYVNPEYQRGSSGGQPLQLQDSDLRRWGHSMVPLKRQDAPTRAGGGQSPEAMTVEPEFFLLFGGMNELVCRSDMLCIDVRNGFVTDFSVAPPAPLSTSRTPTSRGGRSGFVSSPTLANDGRAIGGGVVTAAGRSGGVTFGGGPGVGGLSGPPGAFPTNSRSLPQHQPFLPRPEPQPRRRHTAVVYKSDYLVIFGGRSMVKFWSDVWVLHIPTRVWVAIHKNTSPSSLRHFYSVKERVKNQMSTKKWRATGSPTSPTYAQLLLREVNRLLTPYGELPRTHCVDHGLIPGPNPRTGHCAFMLKESHMYVVSGFETDGVYDDCYSYDLGSNQWSVVSLGSAENRVTKGNSAHSLLRMNNSDNRNQGVALPQVRVPVYRPRSMATATVLPTVPGGGSNPAVFFFGGRNMVPLGDCMVLRLSSRTPSLFRLLSEFITDHQEDLWDEDRMREECPVNIRSDVIELGGAPAALASQPEQPPSFVLQGYPAPTG